MEDKLKTDVIRTRIDIETKERFMQVCNSKGYSPSKVLRNLIQQWLEEQTNTNIDKHRKTDI